MDSADLGIFMRLFRQGLFQPGLFQPGLFQLGLFQQGQTRKVKVHTKDANDIFEVFDHHAELVAAFGAIDMPIDG